MSSNRRLTIKEEQQAFLDAEIERLEDAACKIMERPDMVCKIADTGEPTVSPGIAESADQAWMTCWALREALEDDDAYEVAQWAINLEAVSIELALTEGYGPWEKKGLAEGSGAPGSELPQVIGHIGKRLHKFDNPGRGQSALYKAVGEILTAHGRNLPAKEIMRRLEQEYSHIVQEIDETHIYWSDDRREHTTKIKSLLNQLTEIRKKLG